MDFRKKREKTQINKIRNERRNITTDATEIKRITRDYYEQLHSNNLDNLEEMGKFLETYNLLRLNHEETENLNRTLTSKEFKCANKKSPRSNGFTGEFYETFKEKLTPVLLKLFPKN